MPNKMSKADASRIQSTQAKGGRDVSSSSFAARAQSTGDKAANVARGAQTQTSVPAKPVQTQAPKSNGKK